MKDWKDNIYFVLVEPKEPGNIGASARAIKNMGFRNLCLVGPPSEMTAEAQWLAHNALDILESAEVFESLGDAIKDKAIVVGTTRRTGKRRGVILPVDQGVVRLSEMACSNKIAILFGREDKGLLNEEVAECGFLLKIPTSKVHRSLNLAQAVLIVAYELLKTEYGTAGEQAVKSKTDLKGQHARSRGHSDAFVDHENMSAIFARMAGALKALEYLPRGDRDIEKKIMQNLKYFIARAGITDWEMKMLYGICSRIEEKIGNGKQT